jgi:antitoxin (DNA-binding transcriptional repressor) of toxin-antitoxin stability system
MKAEELAEILAKSNCAQMTEARGNLPTIVEHVQDGHVVTLTKKGHPVAEIFPPGTDEVLRLGSALARAVDAGEASARVRSAARDVRNAAQNHLATAWRYHGPADRDE